APPCSGDPFAPTLRRSGYEAFSARNTPATTRTIEKQFFRTPVTSTAIPSNLPLLGLAPKCNRRGKRHEPPFVRCFHINSRCRPRPCHASAGRTGARNNGYEQSATNSEGQHGAHGERQARKVLRHQRCLKERLRRRCAFLRRPGDAGARREIVRASAGRRLR